MTAGGPQAGTPLLRTVTVERDHYKLQVQRVRAWVKLERRIMEDKKANDPWGPTWYWDSRLEVAEAVERLVVEEPSSSEPFLTITQTFSGTDWNFEHGRMDMATDARWMKDVLESCAEDPEAWEANKLALCDMAETLLNRIEGWR